MSVRFDMAWLTATLLLSLRVAAATAFTPVLGPTSIPSSVRVILALTLGALLVAAVPAAPVAVTALSGLVEAAAAELLIGAALAFGFLAAYAATQLAGKILDVQVGFGAAAILNPTTSTVAPLLGTLFGMLAVLVFLAANGHHVLIRALSLSAQTFPPGRFPAELNWEALFAQASAMFTFGLALAAPVMIALLLADVGMTLLARSMPQLNVFVLSFAVKVVLGLTGLATSVRFAQNVLGALFDDTFRYWQAIAAGA